MQTDKIKISKIRPNTGQIDGLPQNPRLLKDDRFRKLVKSIEDDPEMLDLRELIVVPKDGIYVVIAGNMRLRAMQELKMKEAPCKVLPADTAIEKLKAYTIKDNVPFGEHDWSALANEWDAEQLADWGLDLPVDFGAETNEGLTDPDEVPEVPETPITVLGDVWVMGKHRIVCGDSTEADTVAKCLNGVKPHLMVTDPPYGVEYDPVAAGKRRGMSRIVSGAVLNDDRADWREAWTLFPGDVAYVWHAGTKAHIVALSLEECGFGIRAQIIWRKPGHILGRGHYHIMHEPCLYVVRAGANAHWNGARDQDSVWNVSKQRNGMDAQTSHGTQKPVECMKRPIENNSSPGQAVYEPFSGSGTTIIAGEMTGRAIHAIELSPAYVDVAVKRWQDFTGLQAIHEATGKTFDEMAPAPAETETEQ